MNSLPIARQLKQTIPHKRAAALTDFVRQCLADFLELEVEEIAHDQNFAELGTSSTEAVSFKILLESKLEIPLRTTLLFDYPSLDLLKDYLLSELKLPSQEALYEAQESPMHTPLAKESYQLSKHVSDINLKDIAIIGATGIFPNAPHLDVLWSRVQSGMRLELNGAGYQFGTIADVDFDPSFFALRPEETETLQRPERIMIAILEQLLRESGVSFKELTKSRTGVFLGASPSPTSTQAYKIPLSNTISFYLNLKGPSETIDTFCTSAYVALHHALESMYSGACDYAIVGAINCIDPQDFSLAATKGWYEGLLSKDNLTKSFSDEANGFVRSEGVGLILLQSLQKAVQEHHRIRAVIRGSAVAHGGRSFSLEAPNVRGIREVIDACIDKAGISTDTIDYVEAHGIGNTMADALELGAINDSYKKHSDQHHKRWHVSSVKPTIGHPEKASGMASLLKAIKALETHTLPGIAGLGSINAELPSGHALLLETENKKWQHTHLPRRVALNSYAIGGVNAHIILEEYIPKATTQIRLPNKKGAIIVEKPTISPKKLSEDIEKIISEIFLNVFQTNLATIDRSLSPAQYGFNSLKVVQFVRKVNERLQLQVKLGQILGIENFEEFFTTIEEAYANNKTTETREIIQNIGTDYIKYPLTETQNGLWFIQETQPDNTSFNVPLLFKVSKELNTTWLITALTKVLQEYPALLAQFVKDETTESVAQVIRKLPEHIEVIHHTIAAEEDKVGLLFALLRKPFCLDRELLIRIYTIAEQATETHYVYFVVHHLVIDGLSGIIFTNAFWEHYDRLSRNETYSLKQANKAFIDFVHWEQQYLQSNRAQEDLLWWSETLKNLAPTIPLPYDKTAYAQLDNIGIGNEKINIDQELLLHLKELSVNMNCSMSVVLLSAFNIFLQKITGEKDLAVTTPVAGRPLEKYENSIGCYINLMVTRTYVAPNQTFASLTQQVKHDFVQAIDHSDFPFPEIVSALGLKKDYEQLVLPVSYTYQNIFDDLNPGCPLLEYDVYQETDDHYTLEVYDKDSSIQLNFKYQRALFKQTTIQHHQKMFIHLLKQVLNDPNQAISTYTLLTYEEQMQLQQGFNQQVLEVPANKGIHELIVAQCQKTPDAVALIYDQQTITYAELEKRSRHVALHLQSKGLQPNHCVAVYMERSLEAIVTILGVLRAGGAYVPLDVKNSSERIDFILQDASIQYIVTQDVLLEKVRGFQGQLDISVIEQLQEGILDGILEVHTLPNHLCYVIYTSGSTGKPKGVMVEHQSLVNLGYSMIEYYGLDHNDRVLQFASLSFDMSVEEIFPYLLCGGSIVVRKDEDIEAISFATLVVRHKVTVLNLPPMYFNVLEALSEEERTWLFASIRIVSFGGEALPDSILQAAQKYSFRIFNAYGPTECTVNAAVAELTHSKDVYIGKPIYNTQMYILGKDLELLPVGMQGELCIAGIQVARGYLNNEALSKQSFVDNPFGAGKLYKTGDLARWTHQGFLEYLGRSDEQIKVRGFRVEPGEIEYALAQHPEIKEVVVLANKQPLGISLVAWYTSSLKPISSVELKKFLHGRLPDYMVPDTFIRLEEIPFTSNGKVDKKLLLSTIPIKKQRHSLFEAASTDSEKTIEGIWKEVLQLENISISDNFFEIGGHSLLAIQVTLRLSKFFQQDISLNDLFQAGTIRALAVLITQKKKAPKPDGNGNDHTSPTSLKLIAEVKTIDTVHVLRPQQRTEANILLPGMPGLANAYHELAKALPWQGAVYGLELPGSIKGEALQSIEEIAAYYIKQILPYCEDANVNFVAHSFGGTVLYEMLKQLANNQIHIQHIILVDCFQLVPFNFQELKHRELFCTSFMRFVGLPQIPLSTIAFILEENAESWEENIQALVSKKLNVEREITDRLWHTVKTALTISYKYGEALPYHATLIKASGSNMFDIPNVEHWQKHYQQIRVLESKADHFAVVKEPFCSQWLKAITYDNHHKTHTST